MITIYRKILLNFLYISIVALLISSCVFNINTGSDTLTDIEKEDNSVKQPDTGDTGESTGTLHKVRNQNRLMFYNQRGDFAFIYDQNTLTITSDTYMDGPYGDLTLSINITDLENSSENFYPDRETAFKDRALLSEGIFGEEADFAFEPSKKVFKAGDTYVKEYIVFGRFEVCDVTFERIAVFYNNGFRVEINLKGKQDKITGSINKYFIVDEENCGNQPAWKSGSHESLYKDLISGTASSPALEWFDTFDLIMDTLQINDFKGASAGYSRLMDNRVFEYDPEPKSMISAAYPEFHSAFSGSFDNNINAIIADDTVLALINDFKSEIKSYDDEGSADTILNYYLSIDYFVVMYDEDIISLCFNISPYLGGAHGSYYFETFNYDLSDGRLLELEDLFRYGSAYPGFISDYCRNDLNKQMAEMGIQGGEDWVKDGTDPDHPENFSDFLITPLELIIKFAPYQVGPWAIGDFTVKIPYSALDDIASPEGFIAILTDRNTY